MVKSLHRATSQRIAQQSYPFSKQVYLSLARRQQIESASDFQSDQIKPSFLLHGPSGGGKSTLVKVGLTSRATLLPNTLLRRHGSRAVVDALGRCVFASHAGTMAECTHSRPRPKSQSSLVAGIVVSRGWRLACILSEAGPWHLRVSSIAGSVQAPRLCPARATTEDE